MTKNNIRRERIATAILTGSLVHKLDLHEGMVAKRALDIADKLIVLLDDGQVHTDKPEKDSKHFAMIWRCHRILDANKIGHTLQILDERVAILCSMLSKPITNMPAMSAIERAVRALEAKAKASANEFDMANCLAFRDAARIVREYDQPAEPGVPVSRLRAVIDGNQVTGSWSSKVTRLLETLIAEAEGL